MKINMLITVFALTALCSVKSASAQSIEPVDTTSKLRLKLYLDPQDYDDIVIGFNDTASTAYNYHCDASYLAGVDAAEGLASFSSDGVALSINSVPFPGKTQEVIRLKVQANYSTTYILEKTELDTIPPIYQLWLVDTYTKDSLNLRTASNYSFQVNTSDTASFGNYRFQVVIRQTQLPNFQLLNFNAIKANTGALISWTTANEANFTNFAVERSTDGGGTFTILNQFISSALGTYSYTDKTPPTATDQYRLKITDLNGSVTYSNVVTLLYNTIATTIPGSISVYPNPASSTLNLAITQTDSNPAPYNIQIINITGRVVQTTSTSQPDWQGGISNLVPGTYVIQVIANHNSSLVGRSTFIKL
jgi:hypothetical protein